MQKHHQEPPGGSNETDRTEGREITEGQFVENVLPNIVLMLELEPMKFRRFPSTFLLTTVNR